MDLDLLAPLGTQEQLKENYVHQLRQTVDAYLPSFVFVGEALQNALDAVRESSESGTRQDHAIEVTMDFTQRRVTVTDTGDGFPSAPNLLFLGGGRKAGKKLAGMVGVGLKVVLFSSDHFDLRSRRVDGTSRVTLDDVCTFSVSNPPILELDDAAALPEDPSPLTDLGTELTYSFPVAEPGQSVPERYLRDVWEDCTSASQPDFRSSLDNAIKSVGGKPAPFPNRLAALIAADLRRHTYLGSTSRANEFDKVTVTLTLITDDASLGELAELADGKHHVSCQVTPKYFTVNESLSWATGKKPAVVTKPLGDGGGNLSRAEMQFNVTEYTRPDEFEQLVTNSRGNLPPEVERYRRLLFPKIRSITLTIGRIPPFVLYLPGGPRRVISARGVTTQHDIDVYTGQNQQYVRCFDIVIDVDADLNYGKTHLTDNHLVANVRAFVNDAYRSTIQNAARNLVGKLKTDEPTEDKFWDRPDLQAAELRLKKVPRDENDVIALLFELTGRGHLSEFDWYGLSQRDTYDARAYFRDVGAPEEAASANDLKVIEFKLQGASVARDFDTDDKDIKRVDLVICYEIGESPVGTFQVIALDDSDLARSDELVYPGVTHVLYDTETGRSVQILPLREYVHDHYPPAEPAPLPDDVEETD